MDIWRSNVTEVLVEAIEDGKIVRVSEDYARRESLPILRKDIKVEKKRNPSEISPELLKKPLLPSQSEIGRELIENFHWAISRKRRELGYSRKQLAELIGESEELVKILEYGRIPKEDFVMLNKVQAVLKINIRKDKQDFSGSARALIDEKALGKKREDANNTQLLGEDIEIL